jgi:hypothetical protein
MTREGSHQRREGAIGLQPKRGLQVAWAAEVRPSRPAVGAHAADVAVGVDRHAPADYPAFHRAADCGDAPGGLVAQDAITRIHLGQIGRVQIATAYPAQIHFDHDLLEPQRRPRPRLHHDAPVAGWDERSGARLTGTTIRPGSAWSILAA